MQFRLPIFLVVVGGLMLLSGATARDTAQPQQVRAANNMFPAWSWDGKQIAFTSDRDGDPEVYLMNADGSNQRRLTNTPGRDAHPFFSRDGKRILFQSPRDGGHTNIYIMNADGSDQRPLTFLKGFAGCRSIPPTNRVSRSCGA